MSNAPSLGGDNKPKITGDEPRLGGEKRIPEWDIAVSKMQPVFWFRYDEGEVVRRRPPETVWQGITDEVAVFDRVLSPTEIRNLQLTAIGKLPWRTRLIAAIRAAIRRWFHV